MRLYSVTLLVLIVAWTVTVSPAAVAEPSMHRNYYSIQATSGGLPMLERAGRELQDQPFVRIEKYANSYRLRIGFWDNKAEAEKQLPGIKKHFPDAFVLAAEYKPSNIALDWSGDASRLAGKSSGVNEQSIAAQSGAIRSMILPSNIVSSAPAESSIVSRQEIQPDAAITYQSNIVAFKYSSIPQADAAETAADAVSPVAAEEDVVKPVKAQPAVKPDERPLWRMLQDEQFELLQVEIERMRSKHKKWQPPQELLGLLQQGKLRKEIDDAIQNGDPVTLVRLSHLHPGVFSCEHIDWAWALAEAQAKLNQIDALNLTLHRLIPGCREQDRLATIHKAKSWLSDDMWAALLDRETKAVRSDEGESKFRRLRFDNRMEKLLTAYQAQNKPLFRSLLQQLTDDIAHYRDADAALLSGWHYFSERETGVATQWFDKALSWKPEMSDAYHGLTLSAMQDKRFVDAKRYAESLPDSDEGKRALLRNIAEAMKPVPRFLAMGGGETNAGTTYSAAYAGLIAPIHSRFGRLGNGFVQRWWVDRLTYSYDNNGQNTQAEQLGAEGSLGYQKSGAWGSWAIFAGAVYRDTNFSPDALNNPARGGFVRGRIQIEGERILNQNWRVNLNANYVTGQDSYWARGRLLYNLNARRLIGPEVVVLGDPNFQIRQYGGVAMGLNILSIADVAVRGGAREAVDGTTFYFGLELARPF